MSEIYYSKRKLVVGLSGGVDSAVSAYLVKKNNPSFEVSAVFMQNWDDFLAGNKVVKIKCTQTQDFEDASAVASTLDIELKRINFVDEYWNKVFVDFLEKMKMGVTPNPDILCNSFVKFSHFLNYARNELNADYIVTGHYARIVFNSENKSYYLAKCKDENKDQTYFLCQINFSVLPYLMFPLSDLEKSEVRKIAKSIKLPNFEKKDSTGICFIGENNFNKFISNYFEFKEGKIIDVRAQKVVGKHQGAIFFTIGQRKGLGLGGNKTPYYVVGKDIEKNIVYVDSGYESNFLLSNECIVKDFNWLVNDWEIESFSNQSLTAKFRHRQKEIDVKISFLEDSKTLKVIFDYSVRAITPGQWAVLYSGDICLGGGMIFSSDRVDEFSRPKLSGFL